MRRPRSARDSAPSTRAARRRPLPSRSDRRGAARTAAAAAWRCPPEIRARRRRGRCCSGRSRRHRTAPFQRDVWKTGCARIAILAALETPVHQCYDLRLATAPSRMRTLEGSRRSVWLLLTAVVALAAFVRFWGLGFGLPYTQARPDETFIIDVARSFLRGNFFPTFYDYPWLGMWVTALLYLGYFVWGAINGWFHSIADLL